MTPGELLDELESRKIILSPKGDRLSVDAPIGAMTPDLLAMLREHKADLLRLLSREPDSPQQSLDRMVAETLHRINRACPPDWEPTPQDWERIRTVETEIGRAREAGDAEALRVELQRYEHITTEAFDSADMSI